MENLKKNEHIDLVLETICNQTSADPMLWTSDKWKKQPYSSDRALKSFLSSDIQSLKSSLKTMRKSSLTFNKHTVIARTTHGQEHDGISSYLNFLESFLKEELDQPLDGLQLDEEEKAVFRTYCRFIWWFLVIRIGIAFLDLILYWKSGSGFMRNIIASKSR